MMARRQLIFALTVVTCLTGAIFPACAAAALGDTFLVSRDGFGAKGNNGSSLPAVSADGRFVAFSSSASNLHAADTDTIEDVFVRDLQQNTTTLVSRHTNSTKGNGDSDQPAISADGRFVTFASVASNLHAADTDTIKDVFVRDLQQNTTTLVSRHTNGTKGNGSSSSPAISADGRFVTFASVASNLHPADGDAAGDVFVRDLQQNTTTLVSRATGPSGATSNGSSGEAAISADGRHVGFSSNASNLHPDDDTDALMDVFVRDLQQNTTTLASRAAGPTGANANVEALAPSLSADGRYVTFQSFATNLHPDDTDTSQDVFVRDLQQNTTTLANRATGATGAKSNGPSFTPAISADGRYVTFSSGASNLHPDDSDGTQDVFVRDLQQSTTTLGSRAAGATGANANSESFAPAISADGRFVSFQSFATNLHPDDTDVEQDVFLRDVLGPPPAPAPPAALQGPPGEPGAPGPAGSTSVEQRPAPLFAILAQSRLAVRTGKRLPIAYVTTAAGDAVLEVVRGSRRVATLTARARPGRNTLSLLARLPASARAAQRPRALAPGRYTLRLTVSAHDQTATDRGRLTVTRAKKRR